MANEQFLNELLEKLKTFDKKGAESVCENLINHFYKRPNNNLPHLL